MNPNIVPNPIQFEWDKGNIDKGFKKHGVKNEEAEEIFFDGGSLFLEDIKHSKEEKRYQILGKTENRRLLNVIFTIRGGKARIISARPMNRKERRLYEEENKKTE